MIASSGSCSAASATASSPSRASATTSCPARSSRSRRSRRMIVSSSAIRMRMLRRVSRMLQIASDAVEALKEMGPLRITAEEVGEELELSIENATQAEEGEVVVEQDGAQVFLDAAAAEALDDQVLGVHAHGDHFHFTFDEQTGS